MLESQLRGPLIVGSTLASGPESALRLFARAPAGAALLELRADRLPLDAIGAVIRRTPRPLIVTIRHRRDGGEFDGSEEERSRALRAALDAGARFVDVEWDGPQAALADDRHLGERVILSHHGVACRADALRALYRTMGRRRAAVHKIVAVPDTIDEIAVLPELLRGRDRSAPPLALFALGRAGALSRLLAPSWGSWASYAALGSITAAGQYPVEEMLETYDVLSIGETTRRYGLIGSAVRGSPSPAMHRAAYRQASIDARYFAVETDDLDAFGRLMTSDEAFALEAFGVTMPFKKVLAARVLAGDEVSAASGAVNTVVAASSGWVGYNTDGPAALNCIRDAIDPHHVRVAILGAGGTARAVAYCLKRAGAHVTLFNRTVGRAERVGRRLGVDFASEQALASSEWDVLVQATPRGGDGRRFLEPASLTGRVVLDAVYAPQATALVRDAEERGLVAIDGVRLLAAQAVLQFERMTGAPSELETMQRVARDWLSLPRA